MYDYHMHSYFSSDTNVEMKAMIESAIKKGFKQITFTDHIDYEYNSPEIQFDFDTVEYRKTIEAFREIYKDHIKINLGLEVGIQPHILDKCTALIKNTAPDFVIASLHNVEKKDLYLGEYYIGKTPEEALRYSFEELLEMLDRFQDFSVIGHIDIVKRYDEGVLALPKSIFVEAVTPVLEKLIGMGKGIEVNTSGLRQGLGETLPSYEVLAKYRALGGKIITIGSDAHNPEDIGHSFIEVLEMLQSMGYENIYIFSQMKGQPVAISEVLKSLKSNQA